MLTLGLSGNFSAEDLVPNMHWGYWHDAAAWYRTAS